jgi:hypothetical protein
MRHLSHKQVRYIILFLLKKKKEKEKGWHEFGKNLPLLNRKGKTKV